MALPPPPPRFAPVEPLEVDDLPYVGSTTLVEQGGLLGNPRKLEQLARVGLVLALVVALSGVVAAVGRSGSDDRSTVASTQEEEDPLADDEPDADDDPDVGDESDDVTAPLAVPDGYQVVQGDGVYLVLPATWEYLDPRVMEDAFENEDLEALFPNLDQATRDSMRSVYRSGGVLIAVDPDPDHGGASINILRTPFFGDLDELAEEAEREVVRGFDAEVLESGEVDTPLGPAVRMVYRANVGGFSFDAVQYYVPVGRTLYVITGSQAIDVLDDAIPTLGKGDAPTPV